MEGNQIETGRFRNLFAFVATRKIALMFCLLTVPDTAYAQFRVILLYSGTTQPVSTTLTNPYSQATVSINGTYAVNNKVNVGDPAAYPFAVSGFSLALTTNSDYLTLDMAGVPSLVNVDQVNFGGGYDVVDLASANFSLGNMTFSGVTGDALLWGNVGNDTFHVSQGHDIIDGGPGLDTVVFTLPLSSYTITSTGLSSFMITASDNSSVDDVSNVEFARFSDQTISLVPEPLTLFMLPACLAGMGRCRRRAKHTARVRYRLLPGIW